MSFIPINHLDCTVMQLLLSRITWSWTRTCFSKAISTKEGKIPLVWHLHWVSGVPPEFFLPSRAESGFKLTRYPNTIESCLKLTFSLRDPAPWQGVICCFYCLLVPQKSTTPRRMFTFFERACSSERRQVLSLSTGSGPRKCVVTFKGHTRFLCNFGDISCLVHLFIEARAT